MVELAIVLPLILLILFGITELGRALYQQNILTKTVGSTSRMLSRAYSVIDEANNCTPRPSWSSAILDAENMLKYGDVDGGSNLLLNDIELVSITISSKSLTNFSKAFCTITVAAKADFEPVIGDTLFGFPSFELSASAEERYIGE